MMRAVKSPVALPLAPSGCELLAGRTLSGSYLPVVPDRHSPCLLPEPVSTEPVGETGDPSSICPVPWPANMRALPHILSEVSPDTLFH